MAEKAQPVSEREKREEGKRGGRRERQGWRPRLCGRQGIVVICRVVNAWELKHPSWREERSSCNLSGFGSPGSCKVYPAYISGTSCCGKELLPAIRVACGLCKEGTPGMQFRELSPMLEWTSQWFNLI